MQIATVEHKLTSMHYTLHSFKAADMFNFWLSKQGDFSISFLPLPSCSNHIFIESLSGVGKAKKEIMMGSYEECPSAKLLYFSLLLHPDIPPD